MATQAVTSTSSSVSADPVMSAIDHIDPAFLAGLDCASWGGDRFELFGIHRGNGTMVGFFSGDVGAVAGLGK